MPSVPSAPKVVERGGADLTVVLVGDSALLALWIAARVARRNLSGREA